MGNLSDRIAEWIARSVKDGGSKGAVLGLSGGIDSAVCAALCTKALGAQVLGLMMPCESDTRDEKDALLLARHLGMKTARVDLARSFRAIAEELPEATDLARANLKPRLRMATLYYFANKLSYMVVGTGNKTELMVGYFTKHGDGGADILPPGNLYKRQVRALAAELGVPEPIIAKPPSAGLWSGQTDEHEMGITYEELDDALEAIESGQTDNVSPGVLEKVEGMIARSAHKRSPASIFHPPADVR